ncbi:hypothetical protein SDC9_124027 [bioreactor metagenome]|uniref:Uncharacterized protein n=1 Tax=bioreactor metagenome TaxID=1076179 RepID=A0A645CJE7_9ZZZZ
MVVGLRFEAGQAAVAADHHQPVDAAFDQVAGGLQASLAGAELLAAEGPDDGATASEDRTDVVPAERPDAVPAVDHALVALEDGEDLGSPMDGGAHDCAHGRVHTLGISAAGENSDSDWLCRCLLVHVIPRDGPWRTWFQPRARTNGWSTILATARHYLRAAGTRVSRPGASSRGYPARYRTGYRSDAPATPGSWRPGCRHRRSGRSRAT